MHFIFVGVLSFYTLRDFVLFGCTLNMFVSFSRSYIVHIFYITSLNARDWVCVCVWACTCTCVCACMFLFIMHAHMCIWVIDTDKYLWETEVCMELNTAWDLKFTLLQSSKTGFFVSTRSPDRETFLQNLHETVYWQTHKNFCRSHS